MLGSASLEWGGMVVEGKNGDVYRKALRQCFVPIRYMELELQLQLQLVGTGLIRKNII
jgi:hypothetical protein